jgi:lactate dehydrogenase-like 2-hydroxyacid dehydrogenase
VLTLRRRANCGCAEMAFTLMLILAKKLNRVMGRVSVEQLAQAGYSYRPFDRRHTPNSNWGRIAGVRMLHGSTIGIVGLGEIGREIALRGAAFGMHTLYYQRRRLSDAEERELSASYEPLSALLARSDWILPVLPISPATRGLIGRNELEQMKPGAILVNVSTADAVDRAALIEALRSGRLGGFALDPLYQAPGRKDDELLSFPNVVLSPHLAGSPRFNALDDMAELCEGLARALAASS